MKKLLLFIASAILYISSFGQEFTFQMVFCDAVGNSDTLYFGYDPTATDSVDGKFGENNIIDISYDSIFDVRISNEFAYRWYFSKPSGSFHLKKQIVSKNCPGYATPIAIDIKCKYWPVTATWDSTIWKENCRAGSLITGMPRGYWWDVGFDDAFALCHTYSWYISSFAHEIGHLLGGGHPIGYSPYTYGHGMHIPEINVETVMGNLWEPEQIPFFSNPDLTYNGYAIGTVTSNDVGRVLEQEIPEKVGFLQPESSVTISSSDITNIAYGEVISESSATIQNVTISNGTGLRVRSGETTINNGFTVELGAELEIVNETVHDCP